METEAVQANRNYWHLTLTVKDGLHFVLEKLLKLKESVRRQVLWFTKEMIKNQVQNIGLKWTLF